MSGASMQPALSRDEWVIEPRGEGARAVARDVWRYRRLLRFFASRSFQKLYARTVLGWSWIFIRPLFPLLVTTLVFGQVLSVTSGSNVPYFLFLVVGVTPWEFFASNLMWGTRSLELNRGMLSRIYLPRLILTIAMVAPALVTFLVGLGVIINGLLFTVPKKKLPGDSYDALAQNLLDSTATKQLYEAPPARNLTNELAPATKSPAPITEHTTHHLNTSK